MNITCEMTFAGRAAMEDLRMIPRLWASGSTTVAVVRISLIARHFLVWD
jgi:hypothetical protein